jgi:crotonobetainyl-CoA:carnitine CoA-transferase CaiB-like acyl-CoA transferase
MLPLSGITILDFSTLLPGPLATLILAEAGAEVIKVERPGGDDLRHYPPFEESENPYFAILNRGKRSIAANLRDKAAKQHIYNLVREIDVLVEQFRPGVMHRLGLDYKTLKRINPRLIYCSITGYGQNGPKSGVAAHDLNYIAEAGLLTLTVGRDGVPNVPSAQVADIGGGTFPAIINILLALRKVERDNEGIWLDISMSDNVFCWQSWALAHGEAGGRWPKPGRELITGGSPRYQIYPTLDGQFVAAAPLEDRFWIAFCAAIGLEQRWQDNSSSSADTIKEVSRIIQSHTADYWRKALAGKDVCCSIAVSLQEARKDPHFIARKLFDKRVRLRNGTITSLPVPIVPEFQRAEKEVTYPVEQESIESVAVGCTQ